MSTIQTTHKNIICDICKNKNVNVKKKKRGFGYHLNIVVNYGFLPQVVS